MVRSALTGRTRIGQGPVRFAAFVPAASVVTASLLSALPIVSMSGSLPRVPYGSSSRAIISRRVRLWTSWRSVCRRWLIRSVPICGTRLFGSWSGAMRISVEDV